jgi:serine/threonine protein phosphatase PrpC
VHNGRLNGVLAVSRAFGDVEHKRLASELWKERFSSEPLISEPDVVLHKVAADDEFVILACDGVWDVLTSQQACNLTRSALSAHKNVGVAAEALVRKALERGSQDNVSVCIVLLNQRFGEA